MNQLQLNLLPERRVFTVSDLTARIRDLLAKNFTDILVQGEISNCREAQSGHFYFTLKDERAQIRCVLFKQQRRGMKFRPEDGIQVTVRGSLSVYEARGEYQIYVETLEPVGRGALQLAFEQLKKRLEEEGLFAAERKKALPLLPNRIGVITSPKGAAVRDVVRILIRRFPNVHLTVYPVRVQGDGAAEEIVEALRHFNKKRAADVILVVRGGGSMEDLWAFNEEVVARAIAASSIPIISGIGHESDFTIEILWRTCGRPRHRRQPSWWCRRGANSTSTLPICWKRWQACCATGCWNIHGACTNWPGGAASGGRWICCGSDGSGPMN